MKFHNIEGKIWKSMSWREHTKTVNEFHDSHKPSMCWQWHTSERKLFSRKLINSVRACNTTFTRIGTSTVSTVSESYDACFIRDVLIIVVVARWESIEVNTWMSVLEVLFFQFGNVREILVLMPVLQPILARPSVLLSVPLTEIMRVRRCDKTVVCQNVIGTFFDCSLLRASCQFTLHRCCMAGTQRILFKLSAFVSANVSIVTQGSG